MGQYCMKCMLPMDDGDECPHCGYRMTNSVAAHVLAPGTILNERYLLGKVIGQGGFGITYIGRDIKLNMRIAVKEYYPSGYANRNVEASDSITITDEKQRSFLEDGKTRFLQEARALARFHGNPGVVDVRDYFEGNNTAYIIMEYLEGQDLRRRLKKKLFTADEIFTLMKPIFATLEKIHKENIVHRDISPDNIMLLKDGTLKLMDFGAARLVDYSDQRSLSVVLKSGYAPEEQYRPRGVQGPWTDIYALCATIYKCITGITLDDALERGYEDNTKWPSELGISIMPTQEAVLKKGLAIRKNERFQNLGELQAALKDTSDENVHGAEVNVPSAVASELNRPLRMADDDRTVYEPPVSTATESAEAYSSVREVIFSRNKHSENATPVVAEKPKKHRVGLIVGLAAGIPVFIILLILIITSSTGRRSSSSSNQNAKISMLSSMLWGEYAEESIELDDTENIVNADNFIRYAQYRTVTIDGEEYEMSVLPCAYWVDPTTDTEQILLGYLDRFGEVYVLSGTFSLSPQGNLEVTVNGTLDKPDAAVSPEVLTYQMDLDDSRIRLSSNGKSATYANMAELAYTQIRLSGSVSSDSTIYENIQYIDVTYIEDESNAAVVGFSDGGVTIDGTVSSIYSNIQSIYLKWNHVQRPYNGREEVFNESKTLSFNYINTYPYGFIILKNGKCYLYQETFNAAAPNRQNEIINNVLPVQDTTEDQSVSITFPGYPSISIPAYTQDVYVALLNPDGNPCYFTFQLLLKDTDEVLYTSEMVPPGEEIMEITLSRPLEPGEYDAIIRVATNSLEDGGAMSGTDVETVLFVTAQ